MFWAPEALSCCRTCVCECVYECVCLEEVACGTVAEARIFDARVVRQLLGSVKVERDALEREERRQVRRVVRDHYRGREPPDGAHDAARVRPAGVQLRESGSKRERERYRTWDSGRAEPVAWRRRARSWTTWWVWTGDSPCSARWRPPPRRPTRTARCNWTVSCVVLYSYERERRHGWSESENEAPKFYTYDCTYSTDAHAPDGVERERDADHDGADGEPELVVQRLHEREHAGLLDLRLLEHNADAEAHERLWEVNEALALGGDGERRDRHLCAALGQLAHQAVVRPRVVHELAVEAHRIERHVPTCDMCTLFCSALRGICKSTRVTGNSPRRFESASTRSLQ